MHSYTGAGDLGDVAVSEQQPEAVVVETEEDEFELLTSIVKVTLSYLQVSEEGCGWCGVVGMAD